MIAHIVLRDAAKKVGIDKVGERYKLALEIE